MLAGPGLDNLLGAPRPKQDSGFHLDWLPILHVLFELPLAQGIRDGLGLIDECTEKVNVFYFAVLVDDDSDRNRIVPMLGKNRADPRDYALVIRIILDANTYW